MSGNAANRQEFYADDRVTIFNENVRYVDWPRFLHEAKYVVVTDPPYPNNAGHFTESVDTARDLLACVDCEALVFWNELDAPPVPLPLVAVHIWHRSNVNGRPYEPIYHFHPNGEKRRSEVFRHPAIFNGAGPGCNEYLGHPTQKPVALMRQLIEKVEPAIVLDPFAGIGSTLRAAKDLDRKAVGFEVITEYCEIASRRMGQEVLDLAV